MRRISFFSNPANLALCVSIVWSAVAAIANGQATGPAAAGNAAAAANVNNPVVANATQPAAGVAGNAALPAAGVAPNAATPAPGMNSPAAGGASMFNQYPAVVHQAGAPPTTFGVAPNVQPQRVNGTVVFPNGAVGSAMFGGSAPTFNAQGAAVGQNGVVAPNPPGGVTYAPAGTAVVAVNPAINPGTILPGSVLRNTGVANVAVTGNTTMINGPGTTTARPNGGVQWSGGRWWYFTPQNTWMWYNNGNWVNY